MPKREKTNLALKEAEISKIEELNRREKKALTEQAELLRQRKELEEAEREPENPDPARPFSFADEQFLKVAESLTGGGALHISRVNGSGVAKVATFPIVDAQTMEQQVDSLARKYGGGTFLIELRNADGTYAKQKQVTFDEKAYALPADPSSQANLANDRMLQMMIESRREMTDLLKTLLVSQVQNKPASPFGNMTIADIISLVKTGSGPAMDPKSVMDMATRFMTWGKELAEGKTPGDPGDGEPNILKDLVAPFLQVMQTATAKRPAAPVALPPRIPVPGATPKPLTDPAVPATPAPAVEAPVDPSIQKIKSSFFYKMYVPSLLKAAAEKVDPADVADDILATVPETYHGMVLKLAESPDVVEYLAAFEPAARENAEWVRAVAGSVVDALTSEEEPEVPEAPEATPTNGHGPVPPQALKAGA
jgi:hypothetical protein